MENRLPDDKVSVVVIKCGKCNNHVFVGVSHELNRKEKNEIGKLVANGCTSETISILDYRKLKFNGWCDNKCTTQPKTIPCFRCGECLSIENNGVVINKGTPQETAQCNDCHRIEFGSNLDAGLLEF